MENNTYKMPADILQLATLFSKAGYQLYLVGGCVRDMIMGVKPHDYDMCTNATPDEMMTLCKKYNLMVVPTGEKFGTITIFINSTGYEVTTFRKEAAYSDGRHPDQVEYTTDLIEDLSRRDFTINAIAMDPVSKTFTDPFGGVLDIVTKRLVAVNNPHERIAEDGLRILRAMRFAIKYNLKMDQELIVAIHEHVDMLSEDNGYVSRERVTEEFRKILTSGKSIKYIFAKFRDVIATIIPEIEPCFDFDQNNHYHIHDVYEHMLYVVDDCCLWSNKFEIRMAALLHDIGKPNAYVEDEHGRGHFYGHPKISADICRNMLQTRFRLTNAEYNRIIELIEFHDMTVVETSKSVKKALNAHGSDFMYDWFVLRKADMKDHIYDPDRPPHNITKIQHIMYEILDKQAAFSLKDLKINGNILIKKYGMKPGKEIGDILNQLLEDVINENIENTEDALGAKVSYLLSQKES
jgi:tRNA nucleotidyltransferase (CCA-adding enzyme)